MDKPKVSVIVPIYKVEQYLVECLESIVNQTLRELEIILLDEGDMDRCREIIDFYEQADPRIVAIHEPNPDASYGAKINRGLDRATGEYVAIVEPDDFIELDMYEELYACAERTGANIVKAPYISYFNDNKYSVAKSRDYINKMVPQGKPFSIFQFPQLLAIHPAIWSGLYRLSVLRGEGVRALEAPRAGYIDNRFYVDTYVKLGKIVWLDKPFYYWRQTGENSSSTAANWNRGVMLGRWNENLDMYPKEEYHVFWPYFAEKAWLSIFRHYLEGWDYNEEEYAALVAFLKRFSEEQIQKAPRILAEQKNQMLQCRNEPERFKRVFLQKEPKSECKKAKVEPTRFEPVKRPRYTPSMLEQLCIKLSRKLCLAVFFSGLLSFNLLGLALRAGVYQRLFAEEFCSQLTDLCAVFSIISFAALCVWVAAWLYKKTTAKRRLQAGRKLTICSTFYHVYVTLLKQLAKRQYMDLVICSDIPGGKKLAERLEKTNLFHKVWYVKQYQLPKDEGKGTLDRLLFQHRRQYRKWKALLPFDLDNYGDVYIFHDATPLGKHLQDAKKPYHLIEDGLNFYQFILQTPQARFLVPHDARFVRNRELGIGYFPLGESPYLIDVEVNENKNLQLNLPQVVEVPRAPLQERLTEGDRQLLIKVFQCPKLDRDYSETALVLTEPLFRDKVCESEEEQLGIYQEMAAALKKMGYEVIIKPHPRDKVDYSGLGEEMMKKGFPVELMQFFPELTFGCVAAVVSTAVNIVPAEKKYGWKDGKLVDWDNPYKAREN